MKIYITQAIFLLISISTFSQKIKDNNDLSIFYEKIQGLAENDDCKGALILFTDVLEYEKGFSDKSILYYVNITECLGGVNIGIEQMIEYIDSNKSPSVILQLALKFIRLKQFKESIEYFKLLIEVEPNNIENYEDFFELYFLLSDYDKAIDIIKQGEIISPNNISLLKKQLKAYFKINDFLKCVEVIDRIIENGYEVDFYNKKRNYFTKLIDNDTEYAYNEFKKLLSKDLCNIFYYESLLNYQYNNHLYKKFLETCIYIEACDSSVVDGLIESKCLSNYYLDNKKTAILLLEKGLRLNNSSFYLLYIKAVNLINSKQHKESIIFLEKLQLLQLDNDEIGMVNLLRMSIYLRQKNKNKIKEVFKELIKNPKLKSSITFAEAKNEELSINLKFDKVSGEITASLNILDKDYFKQLFPKFGSN